MTESGSVESLEREETPLEVSPERMVNWCSLHHPEYKEGRAISEDLKQKHAKRSQESVSSSQGLSMHPPASSPASTTGGCYRPPRTRAVLMGDYIVCVCGLNPSFSISVLLFFRLLF